MSRRIVHNLYHKKTNSQARVIKDDNFTYWQLIKTINKYLHNKKLKALDIGCGAGTLSFYLANKGHLITGIDISQKAISSCRESAKIMNLKNTKFIASDFPNSNKLDHDYDIVLLTEVIEHLPNDELAIKKIASLLKPKGLLILSTPSSQAPLYKLKLADDFDKKVGHLRRYSQEQLTEILSKNGLKLKELHKSEGIIRNFLFINPIAGKTIRIINRFGSKFITLLDNISLKLFGESNYILVAQKE